MLTPGALSYSVDKAISQVAASRHRSRADYSRHEYALSAVVEETADSVGEKNVRSARVPVDVAAEPLVIVRPASNENRMRRSALRLADKTRSAGADTLDRPRAGAHFFDVYSRR